MNNIFLYLYLAFLAVPIIEAFLFASTFASSRPMPPI